MQLYLMRHGPYLDKHDDPEEGLSPQGKEIVRSVCFDLRDLGVTPDLILSSPKKRAQETAAIAAEVLDYPRDEILETKLVKSMTPPEETIQYLSGLQGRSILSVGHLPSVRLVASKLLSGNDRLQIQFQAGSVCALDIEGSLSGPAKLNWLLTPRH
jgi:phosphohistidine phosphatase